MGDICFKAERSSPVGNGTLKAIVPSRLSSILLEIGFAHLIVFVGMAAFSYFSCSKMLTVT